MDRENNLQLARNLVELFYPLVELTLLDLDGAIKDVFNAFSALREDQSCDLKSCRIQVPFSELLIAGRQVRSLIYPVYEEKKVTGYMRLRYDLTHFKNLHEQINVLLQPASLDLNRDPLDSWKESIDQLIGAYLIENRVNLQAINAKQKRELFSKLQLKGLFEFKESSSYVASKLQISRATVYNYLKTAADFRRVRIHQVDAFTSEKFGGNPAGVVLDADGLDDSTMRKIARELNLSETAFISPSEIGAFQMRYFTPTGHEIAFCGHSTVGALYMIAKERRYGIETGHYIFDVATPCGVLQMEVQLDDKEIKVAYETPIIKLEETSFSHEEVAKAADIEESMIDASFPVMYEATNKDLFVVIKSLEALKKMECDAKLLTQFSKLHDCVAVCFFTPQAFLQDNHFHMRCFAPLVGIPEDPFTGSVLGGLAACIDTFGFLSKEMNRFRVEQGHFMERPGVVEVEFSRKKDRYYAKVFAQAMHCFSTEINLT